MGSNAREWIRGASAASAGMVLLASAVVAASQPDSGAGPQPATTASAGASAAPPASAAPAASAPAPAAPTAREPAASTPRRTAAAPARAAVAPRGAPGRAFVHVHVDYPGAWLETRDYVDEGPWRRACAAPCDRSLVVQGTDIRVVAPGMTTSNVFRIDPGSGQAQLRVSGGSASARRTGIIGMSAGVPITLAGMGLYSYGRYANKSGFQTAGIVTLVVGAVTVLGSLPFLARGGTKVRDAKGKVIAAVTDGVRF